MLALFVPTDDEALVDGLCGEDLVTIDGRAVKVVTVAIAAA